MPRLSSASMLAGSLLLTLVACGDSMGPAPLTGYYLLTGANGGPPPVLIQATLNCDVFLNKTGLSLAADGSFSLGGQIVTDCTRSGGSISMSVTNLAGTYRASARTLTLRLTNPLAPTITGTYDGSRIRATIPASNQTYPIAVTASFQFYPAPPP